MDLVHLTLLLYGRRQWSLERFSGLPQVTQIIKWQS